MQEQEKLRQQRVDLPGIAFRRSAGAEGKDDARPRRFAAGELRPRLHKIAKVIFFRIFPAAENGDDKLVAPHQDQERIFPARAAVGRAVVRHGKSFLLKQRIRNLHAFSSSSGALSAAISPGVKLYTASQNWQRTSISFCSSRSDARSSAERLASAPSTRSRLQ